MTKIHAVIIEDEAPTARRLCSMIESIRPEWTVAILSGSIAEARNWFDRNPQPDIIFLDIHLADGTAFELIELIELTGLIIFTTAYDEYALRAFTVNGIDYLLKPISRERLTDAIEKFERLTPQPNAQYILEALENMRDPTRQFRMRFLVAKADKMHIVQVSDVAYFYSENRITYAVTLQKQKYCLNVPLDNLIDELNPKEFFRANRQAIVCIRAISKIETYFHNNVIVHTTPESEVKITVSKEKLTAFKQWLNC